MLLSIGMIVKNEEKYLDECLNALNPILNKIDSELIIVDTGSNDKTIEIAKKYTEKVYCHEWNNNFAEMRNKVLSYCKGKWFFSIDADEIGEDFTDLIAFFNSGEFLKYNTAAITIKNYTNSKDKSRYTISVLNRLFAIDDEFKFVGEIHEQPILKSPIISINCTMGHYGYISDDEILIEKKFQRNQNLLLKELQKEPENIYLRFQLSVNYGLHKEYDKALYHIEELYKSLSFKEKKLYRYVVMEYAYLLLISKKYKKCECVCLEGLGLFKEDQMYKIDLFYLLAKSQLILNEFEKSISNYKNYLNLLEKNNNSLILCDPSITNYTLGLNNEAYEEMLRSYFELENYNEVLKCANNIKNDTCLANILNLVIKSYIKLGNIDDLYNYYNNKIINLSEAVIEKFQIDLEKEKLNLSLEECNSIEKLFSNTDNIYGKFNLLRCKENKIEILSSVVSYLLDEEEEKQFFFYGDLIYIYLKYNHDLSQLCSSISYDTLAKYLEYCDKKYGKEFSELLFDNIKDNYDKKDFNSLRIRVVFSRVFLILDKLSDKEYHEVFDYYISDGINIINIIYSEYICENEMVLEMKNSEHKFFLYMSIAKRFKFKDELNYIKYLRKALKSYSYMKKGIEFMLEEIKENKNKKESADDEILKLKNQLIYNINLLISCGKLEEAKIIIDQYEKIMGNDLDIEQLKSKLSIDKFDK